MSEEQQPIIQDVQPQVEGKKLPDKEPEKFEIKNIALFIIIIVVAIVLGISSRSSNTEEEFMSEMPDIVDSVDNQGPGGVVMGEREEDVDSETNTEEANKEKWYVYWNEDTKLWMAYPDWIPLGLSTNYNFKIEARAVLDVEGDETQLDRQNLANGDYGQDIELALPASRQVIDFDDWYAKQYMVLENSGECSLEFNRSLIFYAKGYQIRISLDINKDVQGQLIEEMPEFFGTNPACGDQLVWGEDGQDGFYQTLATQQGSGLAQDWYIIFDRIISTIKLY
jgi:hypothetical protein